MNDLQFLVFVPIAGVCFLLGAGLKAIGNEILNKFIPFLCGVFGGLIAIIAFNTIPDFVPAKNWLDALWVGIGSGLMSTGAHQIYKQFSEAAIKGVLVPIDDEKEDADPNENEGEDVDEFEETLEEGEDS